MEVSSGAARLAGRLLSVERRDRSGANGTVVQTDSVSVVTDAGELRSFDLDGGTSVRILEADLNQEVGRYLQLVSSVRDQDTRRLTIATAGTGDRDLFVSYVSEVPVWKATYRLVMPSSIPGGEAQAQPLLQGWAIVDNTVGQDWDNVQLSLVAGAPQSFIQRISQPYYVQRPVVPLPDRVLLTPQTHQGAIGTSGLGSMSGLVTDIGGGVLPGVSVRLSSNGAMAGSTVTDPSGRYRVSNLAPGTYQIEFRLNGFATRHAALRQRLGRDRHGAERDDAGGRRVGGRERAEFDCRRIAPVADRHRRRRRGRRRRARRPRRRGRTGVAGPGGSATGSARIPRRRRARRAASRRRRGAARRSV